MLAQQEHVVGRGAVHRQRVGTTVRCATVLHVDQRIGQAVAHHVDDHRVAQVATVDVEGVAHRPVAAVGQQVSRPVVAGDQRRLAVDGDGVLAAQPQDAGVAGQLHHLAKFDAVRVVVALDHNVLSEHPAFDQDAGARSVERAAGVAFDPDRAGLVERAPTAPGIVEVQRLHDAGARDTHVIARAQQHVAGLGRDRGQTGDRGIDQQVVARDQRDVHMAGEVAAVQHRRVGRRQRSDRAAQCGHAAMVGHRQAGGPGRQFDVAPGLDQRIAGHADRRLRGALHLLVASTHSRRIGHRQRAGLRRQQHRTASHHGGGQIDRDVGAGLAGHLAVDRLDRCLVAHGDGAGHCGQVDEGVGAQERGLRHHDVRGRMHVDGLGCRRHAGLVQHLHLARRCPDVHGALGGDAGGVAQGRVLSGVNGHQAAAGQQGRLVLQHAVAGCQHDLGAGCHRGQVLDNDVAHGAARYRRYQRYRRCGRHGGAGQRQRTAVGHQRDGARRCRQTGLVDRQRSARSETGKTACAHHGRHRCRIAAALQHDVARGGAGHRSACRDRHAGGADARRARVGLGKVGRQVDVAGSQQPDAFLQNQVITGADVDRAGRALHQPVVEHANPVAAARGVVGGDGDVARGDHVLALGDRAVRGKEHLQAGRDAVDRMAVVAARHHAADLDAAAIGQHEVAQVGLAFDRLDPRGDRLAELADVTCGMEPQLAGRDVDRPGSRAVKDATTLSAQAGVRRAQVGRARCAAGIRPDAEGVQAQRAHGLDDVGI